MLDKIKQIISEIGSFTATTPAEVEHYVSLISQLL